MKNETNPAYYYADNSNPIDFSTFCKYTKEGIYRIGFDKPIPIRLSVNEQLKQIFKYCYLAECNDSLAKMYGYNYAKEIIGKKVLDLHKILESPSNIKAKKRFIKSKYRIYDVETKEKDSDNNIKHYSNNAIGIIENEHLVGIWGMQIDITERKKTEIALRESEEKYRLLVEYSPYGIIIHSNNIIVYVNNAMIKLLDCKSADEILGRDALSLVHPDYIDIVLERINKCQNEMKYTETHEEKFITPNGKIIDVEVTSIPIIYNGIPSSQVVVRDIKRQKKDEQIKTAIYKISELAHSIDTLDEFYKAVHTIVSELMPANNFYIALYEKESEMISFPYFVDEVDEKPNSKEFGKGLTEYVLRTGKSLLADPDIFQELYESNEVESIGAESIDWLGVPLKIKGKVIGVLVVQSYSKGIRYKQSELDILNFISEQIAMSISAKISEEELIKAKTYAEDASKLKSSLLSNMNHELRTPMNGILGFAEIIMEETTDSYFKELAHYIQISGKRLMKTLNSIMDLSQLEAGSNILDFDDFDLIQEIQIIINSFIPVANQKKLYLNFIHSQSSILLYSDKNFVQQIITNLIDNAIKFTPTGGVSVETNLLKIGNSKIAEIKVIDSGIGIAKEYKDIVFNEFRQVSEGHKRNYEGSGLGLSITKKMLELLNGKIVFESYPGKGTIFNIILPVVSNPEAKVTAKTKIHKSELGLVKDAPKKISIGLPKILLIEDNEISIKLTKQFLSKICHMDYSKEPNKAIDMVRKSKYDLILMDINLGNKLDGLQVAQEIRKIKGYENVPIVAVTGYALHGDRERMLKGGCIDYVKKPFDKATLIDTIKRNLNI
ncbi:MAG: PAS domain S-box protein [Ignavibacteria bacterium]|jgi:PAS domain S-box-containing protein